VGFDWLNAIEKYSVITAIRYHKFVPIF